MSGDLKPFLKWAGGKRQLISAMENYRKKYHSTEYNRYFEPFAGASAYLFFLEPKKAIINDVNEELINAYIAVRDNLNELEVFLKWHENEDYTNGSKHYYEVRAWDTLPDFKKRSVAERAARFIYLNKKCFNGLYRVNSKGYFNVPYDHSSSPFKTDLLTLSKVNEYLNSNNIKLTTNDYETAVKSAKKGDLVYFDPPYYPLNDTAKFDKYTVNGFGKDIENKKQEQIRLKKVADKLAKKGVIVLISNSNTDFIRDLYNNRIDNAKSEIEYFIVQEVSATRMINSDPSKRKSRVKNEVLIINRRDDQIENNR